MIANVIYLSISHVVAKTLKVIFVDLFAFVVVLE